MLNALGNIGEFVGAIGVIVSLIYLSVQLRQNTRAVRVASYQEIAHNSLEVLGLIIRDPELAELWARGRESGLAGLNEIERVRWHSLLLAIFRHWDNLHYQYANGALEADLWKSYRFVIGTYLEDFGLQEWWHEYRPAFSAGLQDLIDGLIRAVRLAEPDLIEGP